MSDNRTTEQQCMDCGMPCAADEFHPYAACLMFTGCHDASLVKANLDAVVAFGYQRALEENDCGA